MLVYVSSLLSKILLDHTTSIWGANRPIWLLAFKSHIRYKLNGKPAWKNLEKLEYLKDFNLSYEMAKRMYKKCRIVHDKQLLKYGPYGGTHRCNNEPFMSKMKPNFTIPEEAFEPILDRNTTFSFVQKYTRERLKNKRSIWNEMAVNSKVNQMRQFVAPLLQAESLCNGTQIRVRILVDILYVLE